MCRPPTALLAPFMALLFSSLWNEVVVGAAEATRQWTSKDGEYTVDATLLEVDRVFVKLRKSDGEQVRVPIANLSPSDGEYVEKWQATPEIPGIVPDTLGEPIALLEKIDLSKDAVRGTAQREQGRLITPAKTRLVLRVPTKMPLQYQLRAVAKRTTAPRVFSLAIPMGKHQGLAVFDSGYGKKSGLVWIDGRNEPNNETYFRKGVFTNGRDTEVVVTVHRQHVHAVANDQTVFEWVGDPSRLKLDRRWWSNVPDGELMVSTWTAEYQIKEITLREIRTSEFARFENIGPRADLSQAVALVEHPLGSGSGFLAAPNLLVTNYHVIEDAMVEQIRVEFPGGSQPLPVQAVLLADTKHDLAILSVKTPRAPIPVAYDGHFPQGKPIEVLGNPAVGGGLILRNARVKGTARATMRIDGVDFIQIDADVNPGSSGGPIVNGLGQVVGVTVMKATEEGEKLIREGLARLDDSTDSLKQQQQEGVAFGVPGQQLATSLDRVRRLSRHDAALMSEVHNARVIYSRLRTLAALRALQTLANVPEELYRDALLTRANTPDAVALLSPADRSRVKAALESDQFVQLMEQCEAGLADKLQSLAGSIYFPNDLQRDLASLYRKVEELERFSQRPGTNYRRFSAMFSRLEETLGKLLERAGERLAAATRSS